MVPIIDMANHSNEPDAYYDEDSDGDVEILLRPGFTVPSGNEVTISYGEFKSAAEMLFTYGFIDRNASTDEMKLWLDSLPDDPLMQAKLHIFEQFPTVRLSRTEGRVRWDCPYVHLMVLNEEDGLEFRVLQDTDGGRQLKVFWQGEDATDQAANFETLIQDHPLSPLFRLRAVIVLAGQLTARLGRIQNTPISEQPEGTQLREACIQAAGVLKDIEISLLEATLAALKEQVRLAPLPNGSPRVQTIRRRKSGGAGGGGGYPWRTERFVSVRMAPPRPLEVLGLILGPHVLCAARC